MKALILTFHYVTNYGAVLQALALKRYLTQIGVTANILDYQPRQFGIGDYSFKIKQGTIFSKIKDFIYGNIKALLSIKRKKNFRLFIEKYLDCTKEKYHSIAELNKCKPFADIFITGSDQVWNDEILGQLDEGYFLSFVKDGVAKISYGASIGKDIITAEYATKLRKYLDSFDYISAREETAKSALENAGLSSVTHVLDPVFLLDAEAYEDLMIKPAINDYVFIYCFDNDERCYSLAKLLAEKHKLKSISFSGWTNNFHTHYFINTASPSEFLGYLKNASYVVTNSFHGTAFSIIFEKEFYTIPPKSRASRIESLLNTANLTSRIIYNNTDLEAIKTIDYQITKQHLSESIEISKAYLKNAFAAVNRRKMGYE